MGNSKLVDINGLSRYHENLKGVLDTKQDVIADLAEIRANAAKGATALQEVPAEYVTETELEGKGFATTAQVNAKQDIIADLADIRSGAAAGATALADAKSYADGLNSAMDTRVVVLEAIDHEKLASDASAAAVATVLDGAPEKFDTLKEIAQWIADSESADSAADLITRVGALEAIDHDAYIAADATTLASAKEYADSLASNYDAAGAAAQALADAKSYVDGKGYLTENDLVFATNDDVDALFA